MKCPFCRKGDFAVIDSRHHQGGFPIRRRRICDRCKRKVWTVEQVEENPLQVVKKDNTREPFNAQKIRVGLEKACYKRPISTDFTPGVEYQLRIILRLQTADVEHVPSRL